MSFYSKLKKYIAVPEIPEDISPEKEEAMINKLVDYIVGYGMETPAILFLETFKPLGFIAGSLGEAFAAPFLDFFGAEGMTEYMVLFQKRGNIEKILKKIEERSKEKH